jgi:ribosomal protein S18 acetylase RimI-like enzyme
MITIERAKPQDAAAISIVQVNSWQTAFQSIVPDTYLQAMTPEPCQKMWEQYIAAPHPDKHLVVAKDHNAHIIGFSSGGPNRQSDSRYPCELYSIHLKRSHHGMGIGARLLSHSAHLLKRRSYKSMMLWVFEENRASNRFYEHLGGTVYASQIKYRGGRRIKELARGWADIDQLSRLHQLQK